MNKTETKNEVKLSGWWGLPEETKEEILKSLPEKAAWTFIVTRVSDHAWSLDLPEAETYGELLVSGTNKALDVHYQDMHGVDAKDGDQLLLTCSNEELNICSTILSKRSDDPVWEGSATYLDLVFNIECWLCPFTTILWGEAPPIIWLNLSKVN